MIGTKRRRSSRARKIYWLVDRRTGGTREESGHYTTMIGFQVICRGKIVIWYC
jgi:hypothetical protein